MDEALKTALTTGFTAAKTSVMEVIAVAAPLGLGLMAAFFGVRKGIKFFRTISNG